MVHGQTIAAWLNRAKAAGLHGFGGRCGAAAVAINRVIFEGQGRLVAGFNEPLLDAGHMIGHVAVSYDGIIWDADARPKDEVELESWGMLDVDNDDHRELADASDIEWNDETAEDAILVDFNDEDEVIQHFGTDHIDEMVAILESCRPAAVTEVLRRTEVYRVTA